eukprot:365725-Chlamydomonas_euryale.AAC.10
MTRLTQIRAKAMHTAGFPELGPMQTAPTCTMQGAIMQVACTGFGDGVNLAKCRQLRLKSKFHNAGCMQQRCAATWVPLLSARTCMRPATGASGRTWGWVARSAKTVRAEQHRLAARRAPAP